MNELNPFAQAQVQTVQTNAIAASDAERSIQEVQASMVIAKKFPRDSRKAMDDILNACTRPGLANAAIYSYPRGGQQVEGPSIRLAEAIAQQWQNIQFGIRELSQENGVSTVEAFAWDMQTNTRQTKVFQVKHERKARGKITRLTDPRDIYEMVANNGARRMRACILGIIPGDVVEAAQKQCILTQQNNVDVTPDAIKKMLEVFENEFNVSQELVEKKIGRRADSINAPQMILLRQIYQSLKDGMAKPWEYFEMSEPEALPATKKSTLQIEKKPEEQQEKKSAKEVAKEYKKATQG